MVYFKTLNLKALVSTETELRFISAAAIIGFSNGPPNRCNIPMATGIPNILMPNAQKYV